MITKQSQEKRTSTKISIDLFVDSLPNNLTSRVSRRAKEVSRGKRNEINDLSVKNKDLSGNFFTDKLNVISTIKKGISVDSFNKIQNYTAFTDKEWAFFLDISTKSLQRYRLSPEFRFKSSQSEKIIGMLEVTDMGMEVFGDIETYTLWLRTPNFALGNLKPIELLGDSYGKDLVLGELTRINHGILV
jgi:putative toxin-antitoxin system antitoxin component (TIGR02293 family)